MLLPNKKYNIIYADPPWHFENWNNKTAQTNPNQHYPTMTMKDIANMKVPSDSDLIKVPIPGIHNLSNTIAAIAACRRAGILFEDVLETDPLNPKALWYGGLVALDMEKPNIARERWEQLLALNPPEQISVVLREQINLLGGLSVDGIVGTRRAGVDPELTTLPDEFQLQLYVTFSDELPIVNIGAQAALFIFDLAI